MPPMLHRIATVVFSFLCHQLPERSWGDGDLHAALCHRCTGLYAGAALIIFLLPLMRKKPGKALISLHILFLIQTAVFGYHLIPHPASVRTLSGQLFITGAIFFIWHNIHARWNLYNKKSRSIYYIAGLITSLIFMQILVRIPSESSINIIDELSLIGLLLIFFLCYLTIISFFIKKEKSPDQ
jgi:uncharacterized membrane protein